MSDWEASLDVEDEDDKTISLDDLENEENEQGHGDDPFYNENDWGDSYDDLDSEAWERQYRQNDEEEDVEPDPWDLG